MKKISVLALAGLLALAGCGNNGGGGDTAGGECPVKIGLVTDMGGIDDRSFNQGSWEGVQRFAKDNNLSEDCITFVESKVEADYVTNLVNLAEDGYDLVIATGFLFVDAMTNTAPNYPDTKFLLIDEVVEAENVLSATFAAQESSYLAGMAAALKAKELGSDHIGYVGGMNFETILAFQAGYEEGAKAVNPDVIIHVDYVGDFADAGKAQTLAAKQFDAGAKVIYQVAGNAGNGVIKEAQVRVEAGEELYVVGVDRDQYEDGKYGDGSKSVILTSAMKRVDTATYDASKAILDGKFEAGQIIYNMKNDGVGYPAENPNLSEEVIEKLNKAIEDIKAGTIEVGETPEIGDGSTN